MQKPKKILTVLLAVLLTAGMVTLPVLADSLEETSTGSTPSSESSEESSTPSGENSEESSTPSGESSEESSTPSGESSEESSASSDESSEESSTPSGENSEESSAPSGESSEESSALSGENSEESSTPSDESSEESSAPSDESSEESSAPSDESSEENSAASDAGITVTHGDADQSYSDLASAVAALADGDTLTLSGGTYSVTDNEQMRITADNVTIQGAGSGSTVIDCGAYSVSGQAGILVAADGVTLKDLKVVSSAGSGVSAVKYTFVEGGAIVEGGSVENVRIRSSGPGLNLHGTNAIGIDVLVFESVGKTNISLAMSTDVTVSNTTTVTGGWNTDIGLMYADSDAYATPSSVTIGGGNTFANNLIYSERPSSASGGADSITGCADAGLAVIQADNGTWATVTAGSVDSLPYIEGSDVRYETI